MFEGIEYAGMSDHDCHRYSRTRFEWILCTTLKNLKSSYSIPHIDYFMILLPGQEIDFIKLILS